MTYTSYTIFSLSAHEPLDAVEMHVLAKAYRAAWRCVHASEPTGSHRLTGLGVVIDFDPPARNTAAAASQASSES